MVNPESTTLTDDAATSAGDPGTRADALNRIREVENERLGVERAARVRLMWIGIIIGATVGLTVGYLATLITIVDGGIGDFGFKFYRPNFVQGFLRVITAYLIGGGFVGGLIAYFLFTTRAEAASPIRWIIAFVAYAGGTPLVIGFLLPLTILIFGDFVEGLRPGLWISAFVETLLGSFLDGYIFMVKVLYAGVTGAVLYVLISLGTHLATSRVTSSATDKSGAPSSLIIYVIAAAVALVPLVLLVVGPFSLVTSFTSTLTGEPL